MSELDYRGPAATLGSLGGTTVGQAIFKLANPSAITFLKINADNSVTARSAANFRTDLGLGTFATQNFATPPALGNSTPNSANFTDTTIQSINVSAGSIPINIGTGTTTGTVTIGSGNCAVVIVSNSSGSVTTGAGSFTTIAASGIATFTVAPVFTDQSGSRTALGLGTMAIQNANAVAITGGTVNGTTLGASTPAAATVTTLTATGAVSGTTVTGTGDFLTTGGLGYKAQGINPGFWLDETPSLKGAFVVLDGGVLQIQRRASNFGVFEATIFQIDIGSSIISTALTVNSVINLNASNNAATNIGTGSTSSAIGIGGGSNAVTINSTTGGSITTGAVSGTTGTFSSTLGVTGIATFTVAPVFTDQSGSRTALGLGTIATQAASAVALTGSATVTLSQSTNTRVTVSNVNGGTAATAGFLAANDASTGYVMMSALGTAYTTSGAYVQDGGIIDCGAGMAGGLSLVAQVAPIRFYTGGTASGNLLASMNAANLTMNTAGTTIIMAAGTAGGTGPLKFTSGTNLTTAVAGVMEYNGTNLFFTRTGTTREGVMVGNRGATAPATANIGVILDYFGTSATRVLTTPNTWFSVVGDDGNTYKIAGYS